jgi:hypothetical protein
MHEAALVCRLFNQTGRGLPDGLQSLSEMDIYLTCFLPAIFWPPPRIGTGSF